MADISKIKIQDNTYDIKDATARARNIPSGGTTGQILSKASGNDYDAEWTDPSGGGTWGSITGTLSNQTDLQGALDGKLNKSGDTMTGNLEMDGNNAHIAIQSDIDEDVTPAETLSAKPVVWYDKDGNMIGHIALEQSTSNVLSLKLGVRRLIGNTWTWKQARFHVGTDGNTNLETDGLYNPVERQYATVNTSSASDTVVGSFTLTKGTYIVTLSVSWTANSSGHRRMHLSGFGHICYVSQRATPDLRTYLTKTITITVASTTTYDIYALQNSGSKLECIAVSWITKIA